MPTFSRSLEQSLHRALALANERHHEYATLEHLLLALLDDQDAAAVMRACNVDLDKLRRSLTAYLESELENLITDGAEDSKPTAGFQRVIQRAVIHVQSSGREEVTGANVLVAIFAERESHAAYFLQEQDMTRYDAVNYISHGIAKRPGMSEARPVRGADEETDAKSGDEQKKKGDALAAYCVNLNKKAREGKIDPLIGRESEINRTIQVLCRRQKNNPLFVGDPVAHDRQTALTQREKCAARARRPSLGLRPCFVRLAPAHSHPDCRCCLTLIGARQALAPQGMALDDDSNPRLWGPISPARSKPEMTPANCDSSESSR